MIKNSGERTLSLIGTDGDRLLSAIYAEDAPYWLREVPAVETLRRVWLQQYYIKERGVSGGQRKKAFQLPHLLIR